MIEKKYFFPETSDSSTR